MFLLMTVGRHFFVQIKTAAINNFVCALSSVFVPILVFKFRIWTLLFVFYPCARYKYYLSICQKLIAFSKRLYKTISISYLFKCPDYTILATFSNVREFLSD